MRYAFCVLGLLALACTTKKEVPAAAAPESEPVQVAQQPVAPVRPEPKKPLDAENAKAFVTYLDQLKVGLQKLANSGEDLRLNDNAEYAGSIGALKALKELGTQGGAVQKELAAARKAAGLTKAEVDALLELNRQVVLRESANAQAAELDDQIATLQLHLEQLPAEQRAEASRGMAEMMQMRAATLGLNEMRAKYGDAIVNAMIAQGPELAKRAQELTTITATGDKAAERAAPEKDAKLAPEKIEKAKAK